MDLTYPKSEKLCSKTVIDKLFGQNKPIYEYPLKAFWIIHPLPEQVAVQSLVTVSKRRFKRANKRNLIKRRMREAFRLNKTVLYETATKKNAQIAIMFIYNTNEILPFDIIQSGMIKLLDKICQKIDIDNME